MPRVATPTQAPTRTPSPTPRRRSARPGAALRRTVLSLLLGALLTGITCGVILFGQASSYHISTFVDSKGHHIEYMQTHQDRWYSRMRIHSNRDLHQVPEEELRDELQRRVIEVFDDELGDIIVAPPSWLTWPPPIPSPANEWNEAAVGWPWRAFRLREFRVHGAHVRAPRGVAKIVPWWPGLAADVAAWSAVSWLLLGVPSVAHRLVARRRRSRGACGECGYGRVGLAGGVPCPECGEIAA